MVLSRLLGGIFGSELFVRRTQISSEVSTARSKPRVGVLLTVILLTGLIVPVAACQMLFVVSGSYVRRLVWEGRSPDGRYHLEVRTRVNFPAFDLLGPASTAYFTVTDSQTGQQLATAEAWLGELDYFQSPTVEWTPTHVEVRKFDEFRPTATVRLPLGY